MMTAEEHPSNVLYRGGARGFVHAMDLLGEAAKVERARVRPFDGPPEDPNNQAMIRDLRSLMTLAAKCRLAYQRRVEPLESLPGFDAARRELAWEWMRQAEDEDLVRIGQALLAEDYTGLAF